MLELTPEKEPDHPAAEALLVSASMDFGLTTESAGMEDDFGTPLTLPVEFELDLGQA